MATGCVLWFGLIGANLWAWPGRSKLQGGRNLKFAHAPSSFVSGKRKLRPRDQQSPYFSHVSLKEQALFAPKTQGMPQTALEVGLFPMYTGAIGWERVEEVGKSLLMRITFLIPMVQRGGS